MFNTEINSKANQKQEAQHRIREGTRPSGQGLSAPSVPSISLDAPGRSLAEMQTMAAQRIRDTLGRSRQDIERDNETREALARSNEDLIRKKAARRQESEAKRQADQAAKRQADQAAARRKKAKSTRTTASADPAATLDAAVAAGLASLPRTEPVANEDAAVAADLTSQPATAAEHLSAVDIDTGEILDLSEDRANIPADAVEAAPARARKETGKPKRTRKTGEAQAAQAPSQPRIQPEADAQETPGAGTAPQQNEAFPGRPQTLTADDVEGSSANVRSGDGNAETPGASQEAPSASQEAEASGEPSPEEPEGGEQSKPPVNEDIFGWQRIPEKVFRKGYKAVSGWLERQEKKRYKRSVKATAETEGYEAARVDKYGRADEGISYEDIGSDESRFRKMLRQARDAMRERFFNASLLHIEGERIEIVTGEDGAHYAKRVYSKDVTEAIGLVARTYNMNIRSVMRLVTLRAGLGVDYHGKIAKVDPDKFNLSEKQFVELCRDICKSQDLYGHPMGIVDGKAGGVRDNSGKFVVVGGTRCFPLGYIPKQLINEMSSRVGSPWYGRPAAEIQETMKREWLENTYPDLCRNTTGNLMFQALAIENMMRTFMYMDGIDPQTYGLPEIVERQTRMALDAERSVEVDGDIISANEVKRRKYNGSLSRMKHRHKKTGTFRDIDGSIESEAKSRHGGIDRAARTISILEQGAKAANIGVMISAVPENLIANAEQSAAVRISEAIFSTLNPKVAEQYRMTETLSNLAESKEAIEAREVAESLYRIGGHDAIEAFFAVVGNDGRSRFHLTKADLRTFIQEMGIYGSSPSVSERAREAFKVKPGEENAFLSNAVHALDMIENGMMSSNIFKRRESIMFVRLSMAEMARASAKGRESYTRDQIEQWGAGRSGGEELIRSLLQTDAGREAFMTQGITGLGRKSPIEHGMRLALNKNGVVSLAVRSMFDRFPEYGVNKVIQMVPFSNTISYLVSKGVSSTADIVSPGSALSRMADYQAGSRMSFAEGLRKNLLYDTVMAGEKLMIAAIYCGVIVYMGGIHPPEDKDDLTNWAEWKIGEGENAVPIKWAWWMDDISGVGFPLGTAWAIMLQDDFSPESKRTASKVFINAIVDLNSGTAIFDAIDLVNNFDEEVDSLFGANVKGYDPDYNEWLSTTLEQGFWDLIGDLTPTMIGQLIPWSRDFIFRGDNDAHTASRVYDVGEGSEYTMEEAREGYHTKRVDSYSEYMRRRSSQTNIIQALFYDALKSDDTTGYLYTEQPLDTMPDPYIQAMYNQFYLDLDPATSDLPIEQEARERELYARAEAVCQYIDDHYENATQAALSGFMLNTDARVNCINYCYHMMDVAGEKLGERLDQGRLSDEEYRQAYDDYYAERDLWNGYIYNYFLSEEIPWTLPRYVRQESDRAVRYVDDEGNAMTWLDTLGPDAKAHAESYWYGNSPSLMPWSSPRTQGKGYNYETIPLWMVLDEDGNPVNDTGAIYDNAAGLVAGMGRNEGKNIQELYYGGQGSNMGPESDEVLNIPRNGVPTIGDRPWRIMEETFPDWLRGLDADTVAEMLGIPASIPSDNKGDASDDDNGSGNGGSYSYGGYSYSGGGGGSYEYNPRIYSNSKQVYSDRASGMSTRQPYSPQRTYLHPGFYTIGSRKAYSRQQ